MPPPDEARSEPFTGPYYWIPLASSDWELIKFAEKPSGPEIGHVHIWSEVLLALGRKWGKDPVKLVRRMGDYPYALPRGRVVRLENQRWGIAHGEDTPEGLTLEIVRRAFNLPPNRTIMFFDEHEVMISEHLIALEKDLGIKFDLNAPPEPDFDEF